MFLGRTALHKYCSNKPGGVDQVYLPNLGKGHGPGKSDYAQLRSTYILPVA